MEEIHTQLERIAPADIEKRSFEIISEIIKNEYPGKKLDEKQAPIIKRAIHTTADFSYIDNLVFSEGVVDIALNVIHNGCTIITDTNMALAGINKNKLANFGGEAMCFMADEKVAAEAKKRQVTRAVVSMDKSKELYDNGKNLIFAIGNAPTALIRLYEMIESGLIKPELIVGVPVGFVNVVQSKELIMQTDIPYIVARGRKGGSNVAAAIINALLYY
jgi:precorrin-8X/cobalt-precorrin-8 methylmutase